MSRIEKRFIQIKSEGRAALVTYIAAGDPDTQTCTDILNALPDAGADLIELGMPFTDPMADGPTIQAATQRALKAGMTLSKTLDIVKNFREKNTDTPLILMGYFNPVYVYGCEKFIKDAAAAGVDGLIIVDLPPEEDHELIPFAKSEGIDFIRLITPVTKDARLDVLLNGASGFLYYVSITGVTGSASADHSEVSKHIAEIKQKTDLPIAVGFGIQTPDDAKEFAAFADGVVVGSALIKEIEKNPTNPAPTLLDKVSALREAV